MGSVICAVLGVRCALCADRCLCVCGVRVRCAFTARSIARGAWSRLKRTPSPTLTRYRVPPNYYCNYSTHAHVLVPWGGGEKKQKTKNKKQHQAFAERLGTEVETTQKNWLTETAKTRKEVRRPHARQCVCVVCVCVCVVRVCRVVCRVCGVIQCHFRRFGEADADIIIIVVDSSRPTERSW